jgi:histidine ammonia-lyase
MITIGLEKLNYQNCYEILANNQKIKLDDAALAGVYESYYFLKEFIKDKLIYGVNTGFGPMAQYKISNEDQVQLQYNLIRSHCSGSGNTIAPINVKALMLARLNTYITNNISKHITFHKPINYRSNNNSY